MNVYQRYLSAGNPTYYGRFSFAGKPYLRNLGTPDKEKALTTLRGLIRALEAGRFAEVEASKKRQDTAKLSAIFEAYRSAAITIKKRTRQNNIGMLRSLIRHASPSLAAAVDADIDQLPASILTGQLMRDMQKQLLTAAGDNNLKHDTAAITANSIRRQARSLFTTELLTVDRAYAKLTLPDLTGFLQIPPLEEPPKTYNLPAPDLLAKIRAGAAQLRTDDPNAYRIYILAQGCGLRKGEIKYARWSWIQQRPDGDGWQIRIQTNEEFRPKGKRQRILPLETAAYQALAELRIPNLDPAAPDYILDGNPTERGDDAFRRFSAWLRAQGWTRKKQAHELRKIYGSYVNAQAGLSAAQDLLGHSSIKTTKDYYVGALDLPKIKIFG